MEHGTKHGLKNVKFATECDPDSWGVAAGGRAWWFARMSCLEAHSSVLEHGHQLSISDCQIVINLASRL